MKRLKLMVGAGIVCLSLVALVPGGACDMKHTNQLVPTGRRLLGAKRTKYPSISQSSSRSPESHCRRSCPRRGAPLWRHEHG